MKKTDTMFGEDEEIVKFSVLVKLVTKWCSHFEKQFVNFLEY